MDNKKIGKLIASLRRKNGLTQQELGDKVGVRFRAVSKWETGTTLPDITIINELSKILGISSDELLSGELKHQDDKIDENNIENPEKKKIPTKIKITISIITSLVIIFTFIFIYFNNKTYVYNITSVNKEDCYVEGQVTFRGNKMSIIISKINFKDEEFASTIIKNYEYEITSGREFIFGYGYINSAQSEDKNVAIKELMKKLDINYVVETKFHKKEIINNKITVGFKFLDEKNNEIKKEIQLKLTTLEENK